MNRESSRFCLKMSPLFSIHSAVSVNCLSMLWMAYPIGDINSVVCRVTGEIIIGLKATCYTVVPPDMCLWVVSKKTYYRDDSFDKPESAFVPETSPVCPEICPCSRQTLCRVSCKHDLLLSHVRE